ncbi:RagB/SusD family nutrient uptake outer membrane protein [Halosquirtibacter xylanolyticus]|uniref:RagB/SusD family nutrient uptake outer membrane protein n=1 Tax=Halosquirtibacter xylanolyticus TaxID=3374599 RepID=UPI003748BAE7|nr:RagB/SusD family nutrient uptake outer membrane protein [Prolixibacteraceae bacterium]
MKYILSILSIFTLITGCTLSLDYQPRDAFGEQMAFKDYASWEVMVRGCYSSLGDEALYGGFLSMGIGDLLTDNVEASPQNNGEYQQIYHWTFHAMNPQLTAIWEKAYHTVYLANTIIDQSFPTNDYENHKERYEQMKAEAKLIRSMVHFDLIRLFSSYPFDENSMGVPYIKQRVFSLYQRETIVSNLSNCIDDINEALPLLDKSTSPTTANQRVAYYLLAKIYEYQDQKDKAINTLLHIDLNSSDWIDQSKYRDSWTSYTSEGVLFEIIKTDKDNPQNAWIYYDTRNQRPKWYAPSTVVNSYGDSDVRKNLFFRKVGSNYEITKYMGQPGADMPNGGTVKLLRMAEVHFLLWFLQIDNGDVTTSVVEDLNVYLKQRGESPYTFVDRSSLLDFIEKEYRKEFVYESKHFFRLKIRQQKIVRLISTQTMLLPANDHRFTMPIPSVEMNANKKMKQNDGYES